MKYLLRSVILAAGLFFLATPAFATCGSGSGTCFVVAGGGNSNSTSTWTATTGGSTCTCVPATSDAVILDSAAGQLTINAALTVASLDASGTGGSGSPYTNTLTHGAFTLTINTGVSNSLKFSAGMTYTPASTSALVTLTHTSGTANITSNGKKFFALTINGAGGTTRILDPLLVNFGNNSILTIAAGIFDANGGAGGPYEITANLFNSNNSNVRSVIFGGNVTIGGTATGSQNIWSMATTGTLTFTKNSANIIILPPSAPLILWNFFSAGLTYNDITFNNNTSGTTIALNSTPTFAHFNIGSGWVLQLNGTITVSNAFTWTGTQAHPILIYTVGSSVSTLSVPSGTSTLTWGSLFGIVGSGGATFTATNTFDFGNNAGWAISAPGGGGGGHIIGG